MDWRGVKVEAEARVGVERRGVEVKEEGGADTDATDVTGRIVVEKIVEKIAGVDEIVSKRAKVEWGAGVVEVA